MYEKTRKIPTKNSKYVLKNQLTESRGLVEKQNIFVVMKIRFWKKNKVEYVI